MPHLQTSTQEPFRLGVGDYTCNWGLHVCGFFESAAERDDILFGFLGQGDRDGDFQMLAVFERTREAFRAEYARRYPDRSRHLADPSRFLVLDARDVYYPTGRFDALEVAESIGTLYEGGRAGGARAVRGTAEMSWAAEPVPGREDLFAYEARISAGIDGKRMALLCLYDLNRFGGRFLMDLLRTHPYTLSAGVIHENPFYVRPAEWLARHAAGSPARA